MTHVPSINYCTYVALFVLSRETKTQVDPSPQCEGVFQLFDNDRSGQIDVREFMISLTNYAGTSKDDKLSFAFKVFDEDGNGVITKQEASTVSSTMSSPVLCHNSVK